ncbi:ABC-2 transporter permease [Lacrimispora defluvii]|uniref:ABC-2 transporter permease n=1 Tax=Lacrimispora defluvii TaxID=2719233 RepID=A0ABX1VRA1_9FIRM|nr:ABC-2 transporter permease [Lacrimispora defluvii]NNJ30959.1 ABC-2 transporter permease [Lacrimispora defluvii]
MKGLLIKDLLLLKNQQRFFLLVFFMSAGMLLVDVNTFFVINYVTLISTMFTLSSISYDEFDNGYAFLFTLPITRNQYAAEKYVFGFVTGGSAWIIMTVFVVIMNFVRGRVGTLELVITALLYLLISLLFMAVVVPVQLKFGTEKGRIVLIFIIGVIFAAGFIVVKAAKTFQLDLSTAATALTAFAAGSVITVLFLISLAAIFVSYFISVNIMKKKQF